MIKEKVMKVTFFVYKNRVDKTMGGGGGYNRNIEK